MIHIAIGTKAQFIKMAPVIHRLEAQGIPYRLIDLGQHGLTTQDLRKEFGIREPDVQLSSGSNVSRLGEGIVWMLKMFAKGLKAKRVRAEVFAGQDGYCLIHGDTVSTLLAMWLAKAAGVKVAHVEAGLRSYKLFQPFPEEIVRLITMHRSDVLFAPSDWAQQNLEKMGLGAKSIRLCANTSLEACQYSEAKQIDNGLGPDRYALVTTHRMENIFSRARLELLVETIEEISQTMRVVFVQHQPTVARLDEEQLRERLEKVPGIRFFKIVSHGSFISLLRGASFVITDGGSIQEECFYLDKPCLILRSVTERLEGLGENAMLGNFDKPTISKFLAAWPTLRRHQPLPSITSPSLEIVREIVNRAAS